MYNKPLADYLEGRQIDYHWITHPVAYTAQAAAARAQVPEDEFAKTVVVKLNGKMAMTVLPAGERLSFSRLKEAAGVNEVRLADEPEFAARFPGCEKGAVPPFGGLYGMPVFVSQNLAREGEIAFKAGSHREVVKIAYRDFERLERPRVGDFSD